MRYTKYVLTKLVLFSFIALNAQWDGWGDFEGNSEKTKEIVPDSTDKSSYLDEVLKDTVDEINYLFKSNSVSHFWKLYMERYYNPDPFAPSIDTSSMKIKKFRDNLPKPTVFNNTNLVFHELKLSRVREILIGEIKQLEELSWQNFSQIKLLNTDRNTITGKTFRNDYLTDSIIEYFGLMPGMDPEDPSGYEIKYLKRRMMRPFYLFLVPEKNQILIEMRFSTEGLNSIFIDPNELSEDFKTLKKLLCSKLYTRFINKNPNYNDGLESVISDLIDEEIFNSLNSEDFNWIYLLRDGKLSPAMDIHEFTYNGSTDQIEMVLIDGQDPDDPSSYEHRLVNFEGTLQSQGVVYDYEQDNTSLSVILEHTSKKEEVYSKLVGICFNKRNVVFFDDAIEKNEKGELDFFWFLYKTSFGIN